MDVVSLISKIQEDTVSIIKDKAKRGEMTEGRAREIAQYLLTSLQPQMTFQELYLVVKTIENRFPELIKIVIDVSDVYNELSKKNVLKKVDLLLNNTDVEGAITALENELNSETEIGDNLTSFKHTEIVKEVESDLNPYEELEELAKAE